MGNMGFSGEEFTGDDFTQPQEPADDLDDEERQLLEEVRIQQEQRMRELGERQAKEMA